MSWREALKIIHLLSAMMWFGGAVGARLLAIRVASSRDQARALHFARDMILGTRLFTISKAVVLMSGVLLVIESPAWRFGHDFVIIGLVIAGLAVVLGVIYFKPQSDRVFEEIEGGALGRPHNIARMRLLGRVSVFEMALFVVATWAMVERLGV